MATDAYAPQKRYVQRQKAEGFTSLTVWVPAQDRDYIISEAARLRDRHSTARQGA